MKFFRYIVLEMIKYKARLGLKGLFFFFKNPIGKKSS